MIEIPNENNQIIGLSQKKKLKEHRNVMKLRIFKKKKKNNIGSIKKKNK